MAGLKGEEGAARLSMMNRIISLSPVCVCVCVGLCNSFTFALCEQDQRGMNDTHILLPTQR